MLSYRTTDPAVNKELGFRPIKRITINRPLQKGNELRVRVAYFPSMGHPITAVY